MKKNITILFLLTLFMSNGCKSQVTDIVDPIDPIKVEYSNKEKPRLFFCDSIPSDGIAILRLTINKKLRVEDVNIVEVRKRGKEQKSFKKDTIFNKDTFLYFRNSNFLKSLKITQEVNDYNTFPYITILHVPFKIAKFKNCY